MIQGAFFLASSNRSLTRDAPTPTNISTKSEPEIVKNGTPASPATAFASSVLPVPGGPTSNTPFGILAPTWIYFFGDFRKSTISSSSSFSSSRPATWANVTFLSRSVLSLARLFPKFIAFEFAPPPCRFIRPKSRKTPPSVRITGRNVVAAQLSCGISGIVYSTFCSFR